MPVQVRELVQGDYADWLPLWAGYNAFYGRQGDTELPGEITRTTWQRFFDPGAPVFALVAEEAGQLVGLAHYLFHPTTTQVAYTCYLNDLYTEPSRRGRGVGRALIESVCARAKVAGAERVYWQTHESNAAGRALYGQVARFEGFIVYEREVSSTWVRT